KVGVSLLGNFLGPICIGIGAGFLILELGRPFQSWRVFVNPKAILTFGAWNMLIAIVAGLLLASFGLAQVPWQSAVALRKLLAVVSVITGLVVATYPGVLLGRHKSRPFWVGPGLMSLFLLSSLVTGTAAHLLCGLTTTVTASILPDIFRWVAAGLLVLQLALWVGYVLIKKTGTTYLEAKAAERWLSGDLAGLFKYGFLLIGTIVPIILLIWSMNFAFLGSALVLLGGLLMRWLTVCAGEDRTWLPGEQLYRSRLPKGNEDFLKAWGDK
ncbi:MAG: polysulfide reductase NrfD, partial [Clostridia bacterium]|nr:polysulfide reductase NrfD [Clostridia bacterium]